MPNPPRERAIRPKAPDSGTDPMTDAAPATIPSHPTEQMAPHATPTKKEQPLRMRPLNVDVPEDLQLHRRGTLCKLDTGMSIKEQVAVAYDEWLQRNGYSREQ